jgi:hypothetical protein
MRLLVALSAVMFAWVGQLTRLNVLARDSDKLRLEGELSSKEQWRRILVEQLNSPHPQARAGSVNQLPKVESEIAGLRKQLKEFDRATSAAQEGRGVATR